MLAAPAAAGAVIVRPSADLVGPFRTAKEILEFGSPSQVGRLLQGALAEARSSTRQSDAYDPILTITFQVHRDHAPALKSAIEEITNEVGGRLEAPSRYAKEDALTRAAIGLGSLRRAINAQVSVGDRDYK